MSLRELLREDLETHEHRRKSAGLKGLRVYRFGAWRDELRPGPHRKLLALVYEVLRRRVRDRHHVEIHHTASIGRRVNLSAFGGIVIGNESVVGDDCVIAADVTMAKTKVGQPGRPSLGDRVAVGPGAVFVGGVSVGDDAIIGPNVVVFADVAPGAIVAVTPAQVEPRPQDERFRVPTIAGRTRPLRAQDLSPGSRVGRGVCVSATAPPRAEGRVEIGNDCAFHERVFLGWDPPNEPRGDHISSQVGSRVEISAGAVVLRGVSIGDDVTIGPNAVVDCDVPSGMSVSCREARVFGATKRKALR